MLVSLNKVQQKVKLILIGSPHLYTMVTNRAVGASGRPVEMASDTPFHPDCDPINLDILIKWSTEVIVAILI